MSKLLVWGAGGHGKVVLDAAMAANRWTEIVCVDDAPREALLGISVRSGTELELLREQGFSEFIVAIGANVARARCFERAAASGLSPVVVVHPAATVSRFAGIGPGTLVMPHAVVNASAIVGANCIINTGAIVEHDCEIGDHSHIAPGATLGGAARAGAYAFIGMNASVLPSVQVGDHVIVGAGSVVLKAVPSRQTVAGIPAKPIHAIKTKQHGGL